MSSVVAMPAWLVAWRRNFDSVPPSGFSLPLMTSLSLRHFFKIKRYQVEHRAEVGLQQWAENLQQWTILRANNGKRICNNGPKYSARFATMGREFATMGRGILQDLHNGKRICNNGHNYQTIQALCTLNKHK